jgi:GT2 family glycosyltransferase
MTAPEVSVVICTRNRAESCARTVASLLAAARPGAEIVVVDQSPGPETRLAIAALAGGAAVRHESSPARGLSAARNHGLRLARGSLVLFTDDDCVVEPDWVEAWRRAAAAAPDMGVGFGQVSCPPYDPTRGYTAGFDVRAGSHGVELFRLGTGQVGMGANMVVPRRVWEELGGFDEGLGAGARFVSAEDCDFAYRAVRAGRRILHVREARVWHHGYREGAHASELMRGYVAGISAMYVKHVRCGDGTALRLLASDLGHHVAKVARNVPRRRRPTGLGGLAFYLRGIGASWRWPVDQASRVYRPETSHA